MSLHVEALGGLRVLLHGVERPVLTRQYLRCGLLVYLAMERSAPRERVLSLLWPERPPDRGRHALSQMLYELRRDLEGDWVSLEGDTVTASVEVTADALDFKAAMAAGDTEAAGLYRGPFLDAVRLVDTPEFEGWVEHTRATLRGHFRESQQRLVDGLGAANDFPAALAAARRWVFAEPLDEEAQRRLVELLARSGLRNEALRQFEEYRTRLRALDAEPAAEMMHLVADIRSGHFRETAPGALPTTAPQLGARAGVVVLPFEDMSPGGTHSHFCDGLAEEIISGLSRVPGLRIVPRTSAFAYRGARILDAAAALNVTHAVEGSVRFAEESYRVTVRLIEADAEVELWQDQLSGKLTSEGIFETQERIADAVTLALRDTVGPAQAGVKGPPLHTVRRPRPHTPDAKAYHLYLRGRQCWFLRTPRALREALDYFQNAVAADPDYAQAHAGIADVYALLGAFDYAHLPPSEAYPNARTAAEHALTLDPELASAHAALGNIHVSFDWDLDAGEACYRRAIELDPGYSIARQWYSTLLVLRGQDDEAIAQAILALELDPRSAYVSSHLGRLFQLLRRPQQAAVQYGQALEIDGRFVTAQLGLALAELTLGQRAPALERLEGLVGELGDELPLVSALWGYALGVSGQGAKARGVVQRLKATTARYLPPEHVAVVYLGLGETDRAFTWLERALEARSQAVTLLEVDPLLDPLRRDPRFQVLVAEARKPRAHASEKLVGRAGTD